MKEKHIPASNNSDMSKRSVCLFYIHFLLVLFYGIKKKNEKEEKFLSLLIFFFIFDIIKTYFQVPHQGSIYAHIRVPAGSFSLGFSFSQPFIFLSSSISKTKKKEEKRGERRIEVPPKVQTKIKNLDVLRMSSVLNWAHSI